MVWPVEGSIVSPFGASSRPDHRGIDLASRPGTRVVAAIPGTVNFAGRIPGYGNVITMMHDRHLTTVYAHLGKTEVKEGQRVARGEGIGRIGAEGYLHYEIRRAKDAVDPASFYAVAPKPLPGGGKRRANLSTEPVSEVPITEEAASAAAPVPVAPRSPPAGEALAAEPATRATVMKPATAEPLVAKPPAESDSPASHPGTLGAEAGHEPSTAPSSPSESGAMRVAEGAAVVFSNLLYVPAKLAYASVGAVTGGLVLVVSHDTSVATDVWSQTMGGNYFVLPGHLRGEAPLHFLGGQSKVEPPAPVASPPPAR